MNGGRKRIKELEEELKDIKESYDIVINEKTCDDEKHCTCVPFLRTRIKELEDKVKMYENQIRQFKKDYPFFDDDENWV